MEPSDHENLWKKIFYLILKTFFAYSWMIVYYLIHMLVYMTTIWPMRFENLSKNYNFVRDYPYVI